MFEMNCNTICLKKFLTAYNSKFCVSLKKQILIKIFWNTLRKHRYKLKGESQIGKKMIE